MKVLVLAAGYAVRLQPLTLDRAKPLLDVAGRPVLSRLLDRVVQAGGIDEILVVTNAKFHSQFEEWAQAWETNVPVRLVNDGSTSPENMRGALADLALGWDHLREDDNAEQDVIVVGGDNLIGFDLEPHFRRFAASGRPLLLVREIEGQVPPGRYSEVVLDERDLVTSFREKPARPASNLSCICLYCFTSEIRQRLAEYLGDGGHPDAPGYFLEWLAQRMSLPAARVTGPWFDIGSFEALEEARRAHEAE